MSGDSDKSGDLGKRCFTGGVFGALLTRDVVGSGRNGAEVAVGLGIEGCNLWCEQPDFVGKVEASAERVRL